MTWATENLLRGGAWGGTGINDIMTIENFDEKEIVRHEMMRRAHLGRIDDKVRRSLLDIAFHEAGHAVLAWITGRKIERISMVTDAQHARLLAYPDHEVQGEIEAFLLGRDPNPRPVTPTRSLSEALRQAKLSHKAFQVFQREGKGFQPFKIPGERGMRVDDVQMLAMRHLSAVYRQDGPIRTWTKSSGPSSPEMLG
jgi:Peptidase M50B-like